MLQSALQPSASCTSLSSDTTHAASTSSFSMPLRRMLKQGYMSTGNVDQRDGAVVSYLYKLQEHRKVCVCEGRYEEARVTAGGFAYWRFMKHTHTHTRTHTHRHTHTHTNKHTHTHTQTHTQTHTRTHTCTRKQTHTHVRTHAHTQILCIVVVPQSKAGCQPKLCCPGPKCSQEVLVPGLEHQPSLPFGSSNHILYLSFAGDL